MNVLIRVYNFKKEYLEEFYRTHCYNEEEIYNFNRNKAINRYRDSISNLFCITFDNSSVKGRFYKNIQSMAKNDIINILQKFVDNQLKSSYYTAEISNNRANYEIGDFLISKTISNVVNMNGKYFLFDLGSYGECIRSRPVRFLIPNEKVSCGKKLVEIK